MWRPRQGPKAGLGQLEIIKGAHAMRTWVLEHPGRYAAGNPLTTSVMVSATGERLR
jgi:hypothetical protein